MAKEVSDPDSYGFIDLIASEDGTGIRGGIGVAKAMTATRRTRSSNGAADFDLELIETRTLDANSQELIYEPTLHA